MPVLFDEKTLKHWFEAEGNQTAIVVAGDWENFGKEILRIMAAKDLYILTTDMRSIAIKDVRIMMNAVTTTTPFGKRLIVIPNAERLSLPAAQALLKFLEEPTAGNRILLVTKFPKRLLPTIRSRVQIMRMLTPSLPPEAGELPLRKGEQIDPIDPLRLLTSKNRRGLTEEELAKIHEMIEKRLNREGASGSAYRVLLRLRDYYKIRSVGGNEKLASDILLASLLELESQKR